MAADDQGYNIIKYIIAIFTIPFTKAIVSPASPSRRRQYFIPAPHPRSSVGSLLVALERGWFADEEE
jgi:hypothetical protein